MTSRQSIIDAVRRNRPDSVPLVDIPRFEAPPGDLAVHFANALHFAGGKVLTATAGHVKEWIRRAYPDVRMIASIVPNEFEGTVPIEEMERPHETADIELLVCRADLGVAENGAVWLSEALLGQRAAPFAAEHLAVLLDPSRIVWNMHEAYERIEVDASGFGVFIAGPSKTADIEQSLVIGAHGPRSCTVVLL